MCRTLILCSLVTVCCGANWKSSNFDVTASYIRTTYRTEDRARNDREDLDLAQAVSRSLEANLVNYSKFWGGDQVVSLSSPCVVTAVSAPDLGNGGSTTFVFDKGAVHDWRMSIQGAALEKVIPHEVNHIVFASIFRRPLPRWVDEGGAMHIEGPGERASELERVGASAKNQMLYSFQDVYRATEYPEGDRESDLVFYAQAFLMSDYLFSHGGEKQYFEFIKEGCVKDDWTGALEKFYGISESELQSWCWTEAHRLAGIPALPAETVAFRKFVPKTTVQNVAKPIPAPVLQPQKKVTTHDGPMRQPAWTRRRGPFRNRRR